MSVFRVFVILMGCTLASLSQTSCPCHDELQTVCAAVGDNVSVPCPEWTSEDMRFNLLRDQQVIHNHTCQRRAEVPSSVLLYAGEGVEMHENTANKSVSFMLTSVNARSHALYRCEGIELFPPPGKQVLSTFTILLLIKGHQCKVDKDCRSPETDKDHRWIWILALVPLIIYSVMITIIACITWVKLRRADCQRDYMNTKPKAARDRRKKRGVLNPTPRY